MLVSLFGFVRISDAIGGVPINLCHSVDDTVAYNATVGIQGGSGFKMSKGPHSIHGVQAWSSCASATICPAPTSAARHASATS